MQITILNPNDLSHASSILFSTKENHVFSETKFIIGMELNLTKENKRNKIYILSLKSKPARYLSLASRIS
jgi:hypothetical protein